MRGPITLDHQLKDILKNQSIEPKFFSHHFLLTALKYGTVLIVTYKIDSCKEFKSKTSPFIKIKSNSIFSVHDVYGVKLLSRLRLNFSHLNEHKVRHGFKDGTNCMCDCDSATETTLHFLLQCQEYQTIRLEPLNGIYNLDPKIKELSNDKRLTFIIIRIKVI